MKIYLYFAAAILIVGALWGYGHMRYTAGERASEARMQVQVDAANKRAQLAEDRANDVSNKLGQAIEQQRQDRAAEADRARAAIQPVRLCRSTGNRSGLSASSGTAPATDSAHPVEGVPVPSGRDIGPDLVSLAESCQRDHDTAVAWQKFWSEQAAVPR